MGTQERITRGILNRLEGFDGPLCPWCGGKVRYEMWMEEISMQTLGGDEVDIVAVPREEYHCEDCKKDPVFHVG